MELTPLLHAGCNKKSQGDVVSLLLNEGCPNHVVNSTSGGRSVLYFAAQYGQIHMIEMLAEQGLDVNKSDDEGLNPLHYAAACGKFESVFTLLNLGGRESMTKVGDGHGTPLHQAVAKGHKDIVSLLLNEGCPINVVDSEARWKCPPFCCSIWSNSHDRNVGKTRVGCQYRGNNEGWTPLHAAAANGQLKSVPTLLCFNINWPIESMHHHGSVWINVSKRSLEA